tara:strand:+ start:428 stop:832 length:405 start_codon:yes stop_codon:yes gene_type:complete
VIQAKLLEMFLKQVLKHPAIKELFKYKDEPNELDLAVEELQKSRKDDRVKLNAALDLFKTATESVDKLSGKVKSIDKVIDKFDDKLQQIGKIAHPPAIPLKDINELKESAKDTKWMMGLFKLMKKNPLLKSMFK